MSKNSRRADQDALQAAERAVEQSRLEFERWKLVGDQDEIERKRAKLSRRMAAATRLRRKLKRKRRI